jgi:hypothetical protein
MKTQLDVEADRMLIQSAVGATIKNKGTELTAHVETQTESLSVNFDRSRYTEEQWKEILQEAMRLDEK